MELGRGRKNKKTPSIWKGSSPQYEWLVNVCVVRRRKLDTNNYIRLHSFRRFGSPTEFDDEAKAASLRVSQSVVSVISSSGGREIGWGSGTIIETQILHDDTGLLSATILTSATMLRVGDADTMADDIKVIVNLPNGNSYEGKIIVHDFHFNLAIVGVETYDVLRAANLAHIVDYPTDDKGSISCKLFPGDTVIALGCYFAEPYEHMTTAGKLRCPKFLAGRCELDCKELLKADCQITRCGIGGPIINCCGEVIGIAFYHELCTPFLPINVAVKWWECFKNYGEFYQPWHGMELTNLYAVSVDLLEHISQKVPNFFEGVFIEQVTPGSPAHLAGILQNDVIIECNGKHVRSFLEFFEMIYDKVGKPVELGLVRASDDSRYHRTMVVEETRSNKFNRWPLPALAKRTFKVSDSVITEFTG